MDKYRQDLDGIRALAVILVLLFHIDVTLFKAGFIGVDVFFTISGFLISGIVIKQANKGGFSFKNFYIRRATRLLPAYLFMLVIISFVCWYVLAPLAYYDFLKSALSSTLFISNIYFLINHSGYFSTSVHELPLLHTWSLAVEEQFYLVMPLLIIIWLKIKGFLFRISTLVVMLITTTIFSIYLTNINQGASYFLVISRIHEFFFGMILAVLINHYKERLTPPTLIANILSTLSFSGLIIISIFLSSKDNFPGYIAAVVCLLTMLLIYSGVNTKCLSHKVLGCKPMVWVGLLSYSLYLWHWPIVSLLKYTGTEFTVHVQLIIILASFFGACLSYFYVEKPFRYGRYSKSGFVALVLYMLPAVIIGLLVMNTDKLPSPYSQQLQKIEMMTKSEPEEGRESCHSNLFNKHDSCYLGEKSALKSRAMLWGDSHASHFAPFIDLLAKSQNKKVKDATMGNCPPLQNVADFLPNPRKACLAKNSKILQYIKEQKIEEVYLAGSWFGYYNEVSEMVGSQVAEQQLKAQIQVTVKTLKEYGVKEINFFATVARPSNDLSSCYFKQLAFARGECTFRLSSEQQKLSVKLKSMFTEFGDVRFINVNSLFCKNNICATVIDKIPLYRDGNHLNRYGAQQLATKYMEF